MALILCLIIDQFSLLIKAIITKLVLLDVNFSPVVVRKTHAFSVCNVLLNGDDLFVHINILV